jgi:hypothetical protein
MACLHRFFSVSIAVIVIGAFCQAHLAFLPGACGGAIGDTSVINKDASKTNFDKVYFPIQNKEGARIMDVHMRVYGAQVVPPPSSPAGWTSELKDMDGKPAQAPPYHGVNWTANNAEAAIPPGGYQEEFDVVLKDNDNSHIIDAWVTYEQPQAPGTPGTKEHSFTTFTQQRTSSGSPWTTKDRYTPPGTKQAIGPEGGSMGVGTDGKIVVPPGAVQEETWFAGYVLPGDVARFVGPAVDRASIYKVFAFGPDGRDFALPIIATLSYASVEGLKNPRAYVYDPEQDNWARVEEAQVDPGAKQITFATGHFSHFGIGGDPQPVGGVAELPGSAGTGAANGALLAVVAVAVAAALAAAWYARRRA